MPQQHILHHEHFLPTQILTKVQLVHKLIGATDTDWFLHCFSWHVLISIGGPCQIDSRNFWPTPT